MEIDAEASSRTSGHSLERISEHVYWLTPDGTTDRPVLGAIMGRRATLVVDAGNSPAHARIFLDALAEAGLPSPSYAVLTHWHWDHVFGAALLPVPTLAHIETKRAVRAMGKLEWSDAALEYRVAEGEEIEFCRDMMKLELSEAERSQLVLREPDIAFQTRVEIDLGDVTCEVIHIAGDHATDSVIVNIPGDGVAFISDCIYPAIYGGPRRYTIPTVNALMQRLLDLGASHYLAGHHEAPISRDELAVEAALLQRIGAAVTQFGRNHEAVIDFLRSSTDIVVSADEIELVDYFIAGLE